MHFSLTATITLALTSLTTASPSQPFWQRISDVRAIAAARAGLPGQQVLQPVTRIDDESQLVTFQSTTTQTRTTTLYATPLPSGGVPQCNMVACASCRSFYACRGGESACFQCDTSQYCQCKTTEQAGVRKTCSLGPGRTVPCDAFSDSSVDVFVFPSSDQKSSPTSSGSADAQSGRSLSTPKYCGSGNDSAEPCSMWIDDHDEGIDTYDISQSPGHTVSRDGEVDDEFIDFEV